MQCIFCHKDSSTSISVEHIIPESLGNKHHYLPKGYVCDKCNNYFSVKIEKELMAQPYFVSMRFRNEIITKKGHLVKEKLVFPEVMKSSEVVMCTTEDGLIEVVVDDKELYDLIEAGKTKTMIGQYIPEPEYPNAIMSRFLAKCAYEFFLYNMDKDKYDLCVQELLGKENDVLKSLREYARYGIGRFWQYNQRRIYSEGYLSFREDKCFEMLHEMKLFSKEHTRLPNGYVEAEIYFVTAISGIEYAICLSDPDISEYRKWLKNNNDKSPLEDEKEVVLPFGLSDINPILIRKDDNRIH